MSGLKLSSSKKSSSKKDLLLDYPTLPITPEIAASLGKSPLAASPLKATGPAPESLRTAMARKICDAVSRMSGYRLFLL